jgi:hypothetical protein
MSLGAGFGLEPLRQHDFFKRAIGIMTLIHDTKMIALFPNVNAQRFHHCAVPFGIDLHQCRASQASDV